MNNDKVGPSKVCALPSCYYGLPRNHGPMKMTMVHSSFKLDYIENMQNNAELLGIKDCRVNVKW